MSWTSLLGEDRVEKLQRRELFPRGYQSKSEGERKGEISRTLAEMVEKSLLEKSLCSWNGQVHGYLKQKEMEK